MALGFMSKTSMGNPAFRTFPAMRSEEHTSELQSPVHLGSPSTALITVSGAGSKVTIGKK